MNKEIKDKLMLGIVIVFFIVAGFTFNLYNSLPKLYQNIGVISSIILLLVVLIILGISKIKKY